MKKEISMDRMTKGEAGRMDQDQGISEGMTTPIRYRMEKVEMRLDDVGETAPGDIVRIVVRPSCSLRVDTWEVEERGFEVMSQPKPLQSDGSQLPWATVDVGEPIEVVVKNVSGMPKRFRSRVVGLGAFQE